MHDVDDVPPIGPMLKELREFCKKELSIPVTQDWIAKHGDIARTAVNKFEKEDHGVNSAAVVGGIARGLGLTFEELRLFFEGDLSMEETAARVVLAHNLSMAVEAHRGRWSPRVIAAARIGFVRPPAHGWTSVLDDLARILSADLSPALPRLPAAPPSQTAIPIHPVATADTLRAKAPKRKASTHTQRIKSK